MQTIMMKRSELAKWYRKATVKQFRERLSELQMEKAKLYGSPERTKGGLKQDAQKIKNIKHEISVLKTIANERKLIL